MTNTIAIIGSAGRLEHATRVTRVLYDAMYKQSLKAIQDWDISYGESGGAAFADHLCVRLFLEKRIERLDLFMPAEFSAGRFAEKGGRGDAGKTANRLHRQFSAACGINSLQEISEAVKRGAVLHTFDGFKRRNLEVANHCTHMLAFTFGDMAAPSDFNPDENGFRSPAIAGLRSPGTAHTWGECWRANAKRHVSLTWLETELAGDA